MMADKPTRETLERQQHNLGERHIHLPRDSRSGSDSHAGSTRKPATQNDMASGINATAARQQEEDRRQDDMPGRNYGLEGRQPITENPRTAYDVKGAHHLLDGFTDDDLQRIPIMPPGSRLEQGATYVDLRHVERGEFTAMGNQEADSEHRYVPKSEVTYRLWNKLIGVTNPERRGDADDA